jgi:hypothetical protein
MSRRRTTPAKRKNNNWTMLVIGLLLCGGLIVLRVLTAWSQVTSDAARSGDVVLGTPLQVAAPTRKLGDVSVLPQGTVTHVDVVYFHRTQRCTACQNAGRFARETVETYFAGHLKRGVMSFRELDVENRENTAVARKYDASGSSLYLGVLMNGTEYLCPVEDIWFYTNNRSLFVAFLQRTLAPLVGGL